MAWHRLPSQARNCSIAAVDRVPPKGDYTVQRGGFAGSELDSIPVTGRIIHLEALSNGDLP